MYLWSGESGLGAQVNDFMSLQKRTCLLLKKTADEFLDGQVSWKVNCAVALRSWKILEGNKPSRCHSAHTLLFPVSSLFVLLSLLAPPR